MEDFEKIIIELKEKIENSSNKLVYMKYRNFLNKFGIKSRNSQKIELIYDFLDKHGIGAYAYLDEGWTLEELPLDETIRFRFNDHQEQNSIDDKQSIIDNAKTTEAYNQELPSNQVKDSEASVISIPDDFFKYLFDFGSEHEYERFQSCLDSEFPIGIFLCPKKKDFFSEIVERLLSLEILRKHQYRNIQDNLRSIKLSLQNSVEDSENLNQQDENIWLTSDIFHFNQSTLYNVILGDTGCEIIESEKFNETLQKLALYTAKYYSKQKFILFHCPSENKIKENEKQDVLYQLINTVSKKLPYVFTLKCKYEEDNLVENRNDIVNHFKILLEVPNHEIEIDAGYSLMEIILELQKVQLQSESQILLKLKPEYFHKLTWGNESDEHIYLKYFAIKTLEGKGFNLQKIDSEKVVSSDDEFEEDKKRPDISIQNEVVVEVETLRSKGNHNNVFLNLTKDLLRKMGGWKNSFKEFWLVLPGSEIARNYYQLKKVKEILEHKIKQTGSKIKIFIMMPDYENHRLLEVSFDKIRNPSFEFYHVCNRNIEHKREIIKKKLDFKCVMGLNDEIKKLKSIIQLYDKYCKTGIKGILFFGLPGCGKTLLAEAFANESRRYFFKFSPADIISVWIGQTQKNIRDIFSQVKLKALKAPSLLFIDELDSIGFSRDEFHAHTDQKASINQMLIELQNIKDHDVIVVAATNRLGGIDSALKRSGRLDWKIPIFPPADNERVEMFKYYLRLYSNELKDVDNISAELSKENFEEIGKVSSKFTSSDIELVCRELINDVLLEKTNINTQTIIKYIENYKKGGLTLKPEDVKEFVRECSVLSIDSPKIKLLKDEWEIKDL